MNILIPINGRDRFFPEDEFFYPKSLIDIYGSSLIEHTLRSLKTISGNPRFTFVLQEEECKSFSLDNLVRTLAAPAHAEIVRLCSPTLGAICSCLMAIDQIDPEEELIISNSDQVIASDINQAIKDFRNRGLDCGLITFASNHPRFSYIRHDETDSIVELTEKTVISKLAIAGFYYFRRGGDFIEAAGRVLLNNNSINGAFYISQTINEMILSNKNIDHHQIDTKNYFPLYSPETIKTFQNMLNLKRNMNDQILKRPTLVVPMAGDGSRFLQAGYRLPKPFIDVCGKPMISRVLDNLDHTNFDVVLLARKSHLDAEPKLARELAKLEKIRLVEVDRLTEGSVCTVLLGRREIDREAPLLIANCDQIVDFDCMHFIQDCQQRKLDGSILVFREPTLSSKWSYALMDDQGLVVEVREKMAISEFATVGVYYFSKAAYFIDSAVDMIARNDRVNNEFYTCPVYNYMIAQKQRVGVYEIKQAAMHGIGTPEDLEAYISLRSRPCKTPATRMNSGDVG